MEIKRKIVNWRNMLINKKLFIYFISIIMLINTVSASENASVLLHGEKTDVSLGDDIILKLSAVNIITNSPMTAQIILIPPSGMSVTSSDFVTSGAGQYSSTFNLDPGAGKDIEVRIKTNQAGNFNVNGRVIYYFGNDKLTKEDYAVNLPIIVRAPLSQAKSVSATPIKTTSISSSSLDFSSLIVVGIIILLIVFGVFKRYDMIVLTLVILVGGFLFINLISGISTNTNNNNILNSVNKNITSEEAVNILNNLYSEININQISARKGQVDLNTPDIGESLPDISKYPIKVKNPTDNYVEIFASVEKAGDGKDGWLVDVTKAFNDANIQVNGKTVSVRLRSIASGTGMDYIISNKYIPDAFTPSNELWGEMIKSKGFKIKLAEKRLVGNVAGVVISKKKNDELLMKYGSVNLKVITEAVANNEIAMGYTNPFASSAGLNFLVSTLSSFDEKDPLSEKAVEGFEKFQTNIPFVAYTTVQMRDSAQSGILDGFILEYNQYISTDLRFNYVFIPYGVRHDSPLYELGDLSDEKKEILNKFIEFSKSEKYQNLATEYGFNGYNEYNLKTNEPNGDIIIQSQKLWKQKKDSNKEITAVFVADVSGSMEGAPLNKLKASLLSGSQYISKDISIGLVTFSTDVNINLPIAKFDLNQRSFFTGATEDMQAGGNTAMFDAIIVATKMLMEEKAKNPNTKLMLFVLSDGKSNSGHSLQDIEVMLRALKIPIYTIGYNANINDLQVVSSINEAVSINADTDDVSYKLASLFNAIV